MGDAPQAAAPSRALISHPIQRLCGKQTKVFTINNYHLITLRRITVYTQVRTWNVHVSKTSESLHHATDSSTTFDHHCLLALFQEKCRYNLL